MADDVDRANQHTARHQQQALAAHRARMATSGPGTADCIECGNPIPAERRRLQPGATRCVACQEEIEHGC